MTIALVGSEYMRRAAMESAWISETWVGEGAAATPWYAVMIAHEEIARFRHRDAAERWVKSERWDGC